MKNILVVDTTIPPSSRFDPITNHGLFHGGWFDSNSPPSVLRAVKFHHPSDQAGRTLVRSTTRTELARESASLGFPTGTLATMRNLGIFMPPSPPSVIRSNPWTSCSKRKLFHDSGDASLSSASSARFLLRQIFFSYANKRTIAASLTGIFSTGGLD